MSLDYGRLFGVKVMLSTELQKRDVYSALIADGFMWIKQKHNVNFDKIVRNPTIGRWLEISRNWQSFAVPITSSKGQKLINKLCYQ
jgi:hypothetical protein